MKLRQTWDIIRDTANTVLVLLCIILFVVAILQMLIPLSPLITAAFLLIGTGLGVSKRETRIMSIGGIMLYVLAWPMASNYGPWGAVIPCSIGFLAWGWAVFSQSNSPIANISIDQKTVDL